MAATRFPRHRAVVAWARKQLGKAEDPPGSNTGFFVRFCQAASWLPGSRWAWCRAFVLRAHLEAGFALPDRSAGAWDALDRAARRGDSLSPAGYLRAVPGDEVIWAFGSGHSSIFTGARTVGGTVYIDSIDGNVGDRVQECSRPLSLVKGFIVWHEATAAAKPARRPVGQIVGGISGRRKLVVGPVKVPLPKKKNGPHGVIKPPPLKAATTSTSTNASGSSSTVKVTLVKKPVVAKKKVAARKKTSAETKRETARAKATSPKKKAPRKPASRTARSRKG